MSRDYRDRDGLLTWQDSRIHRCDCGAWRYGTQPCPTCAALRGEQVAA